MTFDKKRENKIKKQPLRKEAVKCQMSIVSCRESGYITLLSVMFMGAIGLIISVSLIVFGLNISRMSFSNEESAIARSLADTCAEMALQRIVNDDFEGVDNLSLARGTCSYTVVKGSGEARTITAQGLAGTVVRKVFITLDALTPTPHISLWREVADF